MPTIRFTNRLDRRVECPDEIVVGTTVLDVLRSYFASHLPHIYAVQIG